MIGSLTYRNIHFKKYNKVILICFYLFIYLGFNLTGFTQPGLSENKNEEITFKDYSRVADSEITEYEEIMITLYVPRIGSTEIPALIQNETAYLPVKELFDFLKIKNSVSPDFRTVDGNFISAEAVYTISKSKNLINFQGKIFELNTTDIIVTETGLYLRSSIFGQVFGLDCQFNFRSLSVQLVTNIELPALREMKMEAMRKNLSHLKGERKADTIVKRIFSVFKLGVVDWSFQTSTETNQKNVNRVALGIGAMILGGETNLFVNYFNNIPFQLKNQFYNWRYVNNDLKAVRQVKLGKILPNPTSTIVDGINGVQINNTPTTYRSSFGTYTISNKTEPGWMVELYVNNVLVDYTKADASGFFTFEVPMVYGNSVVRLRYYGPWGEEQTREQNISVPFNFLPKKRFEYDVSAGILEDGLKSKFSRTQFHYGISNRITIGGGMEYLSSVSDKTMPFVNTSFRIGSNLFFTADHMVGVRSSGLLSYRFPTNLRAELSYLRYDKNQTSVRINYLQEKKLVLTKPFKGPKHSIFSRLTVNQYSFSKLSKNLNFTSTELMVSAVAFGISSNLTNYVIFNKAGIPLAYSNLSATFRLPHKINLLPQFQYEYNQMKFAFLRMEVEKSVFNRGFFNISYQWDLKNKDYIIGIGLRLNLSTLQTTQIVRSNKQNTLTSQMIRGSMIFDTRSGYIGFNSQNNVGRGGLIVAPFLDLNNNGKRDAGEPAASGLKLKVNGGRIQRIDRDTTIRVSGLDPYTNYFIDLDKNSFDNIAWQINKTIIQININPNHFTYLEIPVSVMGEVSGTVYLADKNGSHGLGRIIVNIYNNDSTLVSRVITEADGFFSYFGLLPGKYIVKVDPDQLKKLGMTSSSEFKPVLIERTKIGAFVNGVNFTLIIPENKK